MGKGEALLAEVTAAGLAVRTVSTLNLLDEVPEFVNEGRLLRQDQQQRHQQCRDQSAEAGPFRSARSVARRQKLADRKFMFERSHDASLRHALGPLAVGNVIS
jgi:hypothetical protein